MTLTSQVAKNIIKKLLQGNDYREEIVYLINAEFLQFTINFFKKVAEAKLDNKDISLDWYKKEFLDDSLSSTDIAINSGLNKKTISNMHNSASRKIVLKASLEHYDKLNDDISKLIDSEKELDLTLTIKFKTVSIDLNINESLVVINTLAVKRAEIRGGLWSTAGKRVEKPLMETLCKLYSVSKNNYFAKPVNKKASTEDFEREIDFYLNNGKEDFKCEVKLMGKGNPESADAVIARGSKIFAADKLSNTNINQLNSRKVEWIEFRRKNGFQRFKTVLENLKIPHSDLSANYKGQIEIIFKEIFKE